MDVVRGVPTSPAVSSAVSAVSSAGERVPAVLRDVLPARKDPVRVHARRVRRSRRRASFRGVAAGGFGVLAATVGTEPGLEAGEVVWGGLSAVVGLRALSALLRWAELRRQPPPAPAPAKVSVMGTRPPRSGPARGPLVRLAERERALTGLLVHLGPVADEPRAVAADAAVGLRELGARVTAVERARRGAPADARAGLDAAVGGLVERLEAGVAAYEALVVAAADAVAADATLPAGDAALALRLDEATDSLAGLAAGLREVGR